MCAWLIRITQDFEKPFDSPAILVVGHQTDGKSALVEALMGFQFNHVSAARQHARVHGRGCSPGTPACEAIDTFSLG